ncbi:hypothetical protein PoB_006360100 [Plakobranchus ocellatus]|uniref:SMB domain-containing protein n=1 Tax=Plakobranchus ocellatus TaxID=259542 RepID=A0AAV4CZD1_9GAST|nr:hypothetical protein PoB_006360100 [Plakobranchus ocellatus]
MKQGIISWPILWIIFSCLRLISSEDFAARKYNPDTKLECEPSNTSTSQLCEQIKADVTPSILPTVTAEFISTLASTTQSLYKIDLYQSKSCQDTLTEFAYREGLCGAANPYEYLESSKEIYTCAGRCGHSPTYGKYNSECACDERCIAYKDCCRDIVKECRTSTGAATSLTLILRNCL